ncbi:hypothetical protein D3C80_2006360 [compost metagenome]
MPDNKPSAIPVISPLRVFKQAKDVVGSLIQPFNHRVGELGLQEVAVAPPVMPIAFASRSEPIKVAHIVF